MRNFVFIRRRENSTACPEKDFCLSQERLNIYDKKKQHCYARHAEPSVISSCKAEVGLLSCVLSEI